MLIHLFPKIGFTFPDSFSAANFAQKNPTILSIPFSAATLAVFAVGSTPKTGTFLSFKVPAINIHHSTLFQQPTNFD